MGLGSVTKFDIMDLFYCTVGVVIFVITLNVTIFGVTYGINLDVLSFILPVNVNISLFYNVENVTHSCTILYSTVACTTVIYISTVQNSVNFHLLDRLTLFFLESSSTWYVCIHITAVTGSIMF